MFKYSVRLILFNQPNDNGHLPIYIRITIGGKMSHIATGHFIHPRNWDKKNELVKSIPGASDLNSDITTRKQAVVKRIVDHQVRGQTVTAAEVKQSFTGGNQHNIFEFCESFVKEVKHKRTASTLENYRKHLKVVELYHGSRSLTFEAITREWLVDFEDHLRNPVREGIGKRDALGGNYIYVIWKTLKTFFNAAKKRGIITVYPFGNYENPEYKAPVKNYLNEKELAIIEELADTTNDRLLKQTLAYSLLGCYSGLRLSDWFQFDYDKHVRDGQLFLRANKNGEDVVIPIVGPLERALQRVRHLPLLISEPEMNRTLKKIKGIKKKLSTHCMRHTFAVTLCAEKGISAETCSELMGITLQTCVDNYYKITKKKIRDEVLRAWG